MPKVTILNENLSFDISVGGSLMSACEEIGSSINFGCRSAACGVCQIRVLEGYDNLNTVKQDEKNFLTALDADDSDRLCCQVNVFGDLTFEVVD